MKLNRGYRGTLTVVALILAGILGWLAWSDQNPKLSGSTLSDVIQEESFSSGTYDFSYQFSGETDIAGFMSASQGKAAPGADSSQRTTMAIEGLVQRAFFSMGKSRVLFYDLKIQDFSSQLVVGGVGAIPKPDLRTFAVEWSDDLSEPRIYLPSGALSSMNFTLLAHLVQFDLSLLPDAVKDQTTAVEHDATGAYQVSYKWDANSAAPKLSKSDKTYLETQNLPAQESTLHVALTLSKRSNQLNSIVGAEDTSIKSQGHELARSHTELRLHLQDSGSLTLSAIQKFLTESQTTSFSKLRSLYFRDPGKAAADQIDHGALQRTFDAWNDQTAADRDLFMRDLYIAARFRQDVASWALEKFRDRSVPFENKHLLLRALVLNGSDKVQEELKQEFEDLNNVDQKVYLLVYLADLKQPNEGSLNLFQEARRSQTDEIRSTAWLGTGTLAFHQKNKNKALADKITHTIQEAISQSTNPDELSLLWGALGNTGGASIMELVHKNYPGSSPELQKRMIKAVRLLETPEATSFLIQELQSASVEVRRMAAEMLKYRSLTTQHIRGLVDIIRKDDDSIVRSSLLRVLGPRINDNSDARDAVAFIAQHDALLELRRTAKEYIQIMP